MELSKKRKKKELNNKNKLKLRDHEGNFLPDHFYKAWRSEVGKKDWGGIRHNQHTLPILKLWALFNGKTIANWGVQS